MTEACQCIFDAGSDRRRKFDTVKLEESRVALQRVVATLRSGSSSQISRFISEIQGFPTNQEAMAHVMRMVRETNEGLRDLNL